MEKKKTFGFVAGPIQSEKLGDYAYTLASSLLKDLYGGTDDLMESSMAKLEDFERWSFLL